jgi:putative hydrolase of the HAD superfamily
MDEASFPALIRSVSVPLVPIPPPDPPPPLAGLLYSGAPLRELPGISGEGIRGVLFDVYGTLFISAAGDISGTGSDPLVSGGLEKALDALAGEYAPQYRGEELRSYFHSEIRRRHEEIKLPYPEVSFDEIWTDFLRKLRGKGGPKTTALEACLPEQEGRELALRYELAVNPVFPMPGARETLERLRQAGFILGLISNAQFFTPLLFDAFFGAPPEKLGFDPGLLIYSYELGEAKPSPRLFSLAKKRLKALGVSAENCLYVGNDMLKDIAPASAAGFKTALFAGDRRSLRFRQEEPLVRNLKPQVIIRRLQDLFFIRVEGV